MQVDPIDFAQHEADRTVPTEDAPNREADVVGVETRRGHLVQQRLERVEVVGVDQGHVDLGLRQTLGGADATESGSDDDDMRANHHHERYRSHVPSVTEVSLPTWAEKRA